MKKYDPAFRGRCQRQRSAITAGHCKSYAETQPDEFIAGKSRLTGQIRILHKKNPIRKPRLTGCIDFVFKSFDGKIPPDEFWPDLSNDQRSNPKSPT
jgi:hypothetical protein